jgi:hypothetical protein
MIRKITLTVAAAALTMGGVVAFAGPAGAGAKVPLGDAHGPLNCSGITAKVKFNPPLANNNSSRRSRHQEQDQRTVLGLVERRTECRGHQGEGAPARSG